MNARRLKMACVAAPACVVTLISGVISAEPKKLDTALIEQLTGAKGKLDTAEGAFKVSVTTSSGTSRR